MAKKRRVAVAPEAKKSQSQRDPSGGFFLRFGRERGWLPRSLASLLLGGILVACVYFPSDSDQVEQGGGLWISFACIAFATISTAWFAQPSCEGAGPRKQSGEATGLSRKAFVSRAVDILLVLLATWMMIAAVGSSPPGNLREATNEAWLWVAGCVFVIGARRHLRSLAVVRVTLALLVAISVYLAGHSLHQHFVSLPALQASYRSNPDNALREAGIEAAPGSVERMIYESRLFDGEAPATFALANSLAGALLIGFGIACVAAIGSWKQLPDGRLANRMIRLLPAAIACSVLAVAIFLLNSRSALLAMILAIGLVAAKIGFAGQRRIWRLRGIAPMFAIACASLVLVGMVVAAFGKSEWFDQAPQSLAFRIQYWRTTLAMTFDRPLFSAGPGNFQSIYEQYREENAIEDPAEPHNFWFESLGAGGFVGCMLVTLLIGAIVYLAWSSNDDLKAAKADVCDDDVAGHQVWWGSGFCCVCVWFMGFITRQVPDVAASIVSIPLAVAAGFFIYAQVRDWPWVVCRRAAAVALVTVMVHLLASGGWTIPGVAVLVWTCVGMLAVPIHSETDERALSGMSRIRSIGTVVAGVAVLVLLRWYSIGPVGNAQRLIAEAEYFNRQPDRAASLLDTAIEQDPWGVKAPLYRSDMLRWEIVIQQDSPIKRDRWNGLIATARSRAGQDPPLVKQIADQRIHFYQRYGKREDLKQAAKDLEQVLQWSPTDLKAIAQLADVMRELGDVSLSQELAERALRISQIDDNLERSLEKQLILTAKPLGSAAKSPKQVAASGLIANLLD